MRTKKPQPPFHRGATVTAKPTETLVRKSEKGYVLLVFIMFSALLVVGLSAIIPQVAFEGQRAKEEELLFRGQQYQRAIQLFFRKFGRYPNSLEELEKTNGIRFLRKAYLDPMTKENDWRLIHIGPGGSFPDAKNTPKPPANLSALTPSQQGTGLEASPGMFQTPSGGGSAGAALGGPLQAASQAIGQAIFGQLQSATPALNPSANPSANPLQQPRAFAGQPNLNPSLTGQFPFGVPGSKPPISPTTSGAFNASAQSSGAQVFGGGGIAGVASQSTEGSIKVFNGYRQHDDWEFIYNFRWDPIGVAALAKMTGVQNQPAASTQPPAQQPPQRQPAGVRTPQVPQWLGAPPRDARRPTAPVFPRPPFPGLPSTQQPR